MECAEQYETKMSAAHSKSEYTRQWIHNIMKVGIGQESEVLGIMLKCVSYGLYAWQIFSNIINFINYLFL